MNNDIGPIIQILKKTYQLDISMYDDVFLLRTVQKRCEVTNMKSISDYATYLSTNEIEVNSFLSGLNVSWSEFFRNPHVYAQLEESIFPNLINQKTDNGELRIWSAGCSTGQEPYSIAMILESLLELTRMKFRYRIIATDISDESIVVARNGIYHEAEVQNIRMKELNKFFIRSGDTYSISDRIKKNVHFSNYDLLDKLSRNPHASVFGDFDLVICSNVLLYYNFESRNFMINKLIQSMNSNGYLITGEAERHFVRENSELMQIAEPYPVFRKRN